MSKARDELVNQQDGFDLTPMIDCTFLLVIFFMVVTELVKIDYESLTLPKATQAQDDLKAPKNREIINVTYSPPVGAQASSMSNIIIRGIKYDNQDKLVAYLKVKAAQAGKSGAANNDSNLSVKIRADGRAEYQRVQHAMVACMKAGVSRVSFGAEPEQGKR